MLFEKVLFVMGGAMVTCSQTLSDALFCGMRYSSIVRNSFKMMAMPSILLSGIEGSGAYFMLGLITCISCKINVNMKVIIITVDRSAIPLSGMSWN